MLFPFYSRSLESLQTVITVPEQSPFLFHLTVGFIPPLCIISILLVRLNDFSVSLKLT